MTNQRSSGRTRASGDQLAAVGSTRRTTTARQEQNSMPRRRIDASHVIAFQDGGHRHLRDGVVVTDGSNIIHVGPQGSWNGPVDETVDARGMVVTPGFINNSHPPLRISSGQELRRG